MVDDKVRTMQTPLNIKIRAGLALAAAGVVFGTIGWSQARPEMPNGVLMLVSHSHAITLVLTLIVLGALVTAAGALLGGRYGREISWISLPAGLALWSLHSTNMTSLLQQYSDSAERAAMFRGLLFDALAWSAILAVVGLAIIKFKKTDISPAGEAEAKHKNQMLLPIAATSVLAYILLRILMKAGPTRMFDDVGGLVNVTSPVASGQAIFGTAVAFGVATYLVHQIFKSTAVWYHLLSLPIVACAIYLPAARVSVHSGLDKFHVPLVPEGLAVATVLPIQLIGMGSLAVLAGYWYSMRAHRERREQFAALIAEAE